MISLEVEKEKDGLGPVGAEIVDAGARLEIVDVVGVEVLDHARLGAFLHAANAAQSHYESEHDGRVQLDSPLFSPAPEAAAAAAVLNLLT